MSTFCSKVPSRTWLFDALGWIVFQTFLLITLKVLRTADLVFCRMSLHWDLSDVFLMMTRGLWVLGRKVAGVKCHFIASYQGYVPWTWLLTIGIDLDCLAKAVLARSHGELLSSPPLEESHRVHLLRKELSVALLRVEFVFLSFLAFFHCLFGASPTAYGGSLARGWIRAVAFGLHHSHTNARSEPRLQPTPRLMATLDP